MGMGCAGIIGWVGEIPGEGDIIFRDLVGKLEVLNIECEKYGGISFDRLIERYAIDSQAVGTRSRPIR